MKDRNAPFTKQLMDKTFPDCCNVLIKEMRPTADVITKYSLLCCEEEITFYFVTLFCP